MDQREKAESEAGNTRADGGGIQGLVMTGPLTKLQDPSGQVWEPPHVLTPSINGKIHIPLAHQEAVESKLLPSPAMTMNLIYLGSLVSHTVSSDTGPTEGSPRTTQERCLKSDRCLGWHPAPHSLIYRPQEVT